MFITLFNLQGARRSAKLIDITTSFSHCQELFSSFFKLFQALSSAEITFSCINQAVELGRRSRSDFDMLPLTQPFVKNFFQVFQTFLKFSAQISLVRGALSSARLSYQSLSQKSTPFSDISSVWSFCQSSVAFPTLPLCSSQIGAGTPAATQAASSVCPQTDVTCRILTCLFLLS